MAQGVSRMFGWRGGGLAGETPRRARPGASPRPSALELLHYDFARGLRPHAVVVEVLTRGIERECELLPRQEHTTVELVLEERVRAMIGRAARRIDERHNRSDRNHQILWVHRIRTDRRFDTRSGCSSQQHCI